MSLSPPQPTSKEIVNQVIDYVSITEKLREIYAKRTESQLELEKVIENENGLNKRKEVGQDASGTTAKAAAGAGAGAGAAPTAMFVAAAHAEKKAEKEKERKSQSPVCPLLAQHIDRVNAKFTLEKWRIPSHLVLLMSQMSNPSWAIQTLDKFLDITLTKIIKNKTLFLKGMLERVGEAPCIELSELSYPVKVLFKKGIQLLVQEKKLSSIDVIETKVWNSVADLDIEAARKVLLDFQSSLAEKSSQPSDSYASNPIEIFQRIIQRLRLKQKNAIRKQMRVWALLSPAVRQRFEHWLQQGKIQASDVGPAIVDELVRYPDFVQLIIVSSFMQTWEEQEKAGDVHPSSAILSFVHSYKKDHPEFQALKKLTPEEVQTLSVAGAKWFDYGYAPPQMVHHDPYLMSSWPLSDSAAVDPLGDEKDESMEEEEREEEGEENKNKNENNTDENIADEKGDGDVVDDGDEKVGEEGLEDCFIGGADDGKEDEELEEEEGEVDEEEVEGDEKEKVDEEEGYGEEVEVENDDDSSSRNSGSTGEEEEEEEEEEDEEEEESGENDKVSINEHDWHKLVDLPFALVADDTKWAVEKLLQKGILSWDLCRSDVTAFVHRLDMLPFQVREEIVEQALEEESPSDLQDPITFLNSMIDLHEAQSRATVEMQIDG